MESTRDQALRVDAAMMNTLDASRLEPLLSDAFHYGSQWEFAEMASKVEYLDYTAPTLRTVRDSGVAVWAQGGRDDLKAVVLATVEGGKLKRRDMRRAMR
ncbi:MAG: hypothetical protein RLZZ200_1313 [Pseudomonadota bacterium]|jgi:hypothetical protein